MLTHMFVGANGCVVQCIASCQNAVKKGLPEFAERAEAETKLAALEVH